MFCYRIFGFGLCSNIALKSLESEGRFDTADVTLRVEDVDCLINQQLNGDFGVIDVGVGGNEVRLDLKGAVVHVCNGKSIEIFRDSSFASEKIESLLSGPIMATVSFQRDRFVLHVGAVARGSNVLLLGGVAGSGKSTLAYFLGQKSGFSLLSDDAGSVEINRCAPKFFPGSRSVRLCEDAASCLVGNYTMFPVSDDRKRIVDASSALAMDYHVSGLLMLRFDAGPVRIDRVHGIEAFEAVRHSVYRPWGGLNFCTQEKLGVFVQEFLRKLPVFRLTRSRNLHDMQSVADRVLEFYQEIDASSIN